MTRSASRDQWRDVDAEHQVIAIEAKTGKILWRFRRTVPEGSLVPHQTSRGVALYGDRVFFATGEAILVAIDAKTGKEVWATKVEENRNGYYITMAPLVADGKVIVGASGGERGIRGFVAAFDPGSGKELWRTFTVPAPGEPGSETWPKGDQCKNGGGSIWVTPNYDPQTNIAYWGTGNGGPGWATDAPATISHRVHDRSMPRPQAQGLPWYNPNESGLGRSVSADSRRFQTRSRTYSLITMPRRLSLASRTIRRQDQC
jgi:glucose dehydrogenase